MKRETHIQQMVRTLIDEHGCICQAIAHMEKHLENLKSQPPSYLGDNPKYLGELRRRRTHLKKTYSKCSCGRDF